MGKWVKLGEIASFQTGPFGTQLKASEYVPQGTPIINVKNIGYGNLILDDMDMVPETVCGRLKVHLLKEGDIVFGRKGSVDRHCYIKRENEGWMQGSDCIRARINEGVNPQFVSYYLMLKQVKKQIISAAVGSTMPSLNTKILENVRICLPSVKIQDSIVSLLSALDDKVENNNRMNVELEAMAKSIYDYWFLQFDFPDKNGKPYKSSGGKMVWNGELHKEIPEGWRIGGLSEIAQIVMGSSPNGISLNENRDGIIFYQGKTDFGKRFPSVRMYTNMPIRFAEPMDILMSVRAPVGDINIADKKCCIGRGLAAIHSKNPTFLFYLLLANQFQFQKYNNGGTTFGAITKDDLYKTRVVIPDDYIIELFENQVRTYDKIILRNSVENDELMSLQKFLLPLLMNMKVSFK